MTLPDICPLDSSTKCRGMDCHLFCLEWRTKEPICLIGYGATRRRGSKVDSKKDTYAEETFKNPGRHAPKSKTCQEIGDWIPRRATETPPQKPAEKEIPHLLRGSRRAWPEGPVSNHQGLQKEGKLEKNPSESLSESRKEKTNYTGNESAATRFRCQTKRDQVEENPTICAKIQSQENPKGQEKVISRNKHATIFAPCSGKEDSSCRLPGKEEHPKKPAAPGEKRKKVDEVMDLDLPENYEEEFWS